MDDATDAPEEWRPIRGYEGRYEVSNLGRVWSVLRYVLTRQDHTRRAGGNYLRPSPTKSGHLEVNLGGRTRHVHVLVAEAFLGARPEGADCVCHNNGDPSDNRLENLRYDDRSGNSFDRRLHGGDHEVNKVRCPQGHPLAAPNLVASDNREGRTRRCLACSRARARINSGVPRWQGFTLQELSDMKYAEILAAHNLTEIPDPVPIQEIHPSVRHKVRRAAV